MVSRGTRYIYIISKYGFLLLFFLSKQIFFFLFAVSLKHWEKMSYFTNIHCHTAVTRNLQVAILLHESITLSSHLPAFINCIVAEHCEDVTQIRTRSRTGALQWQQVNWHHEGHLVPTSGCSRGPVGLPTFLWSTAPTTLDTPKH